MRWMLSLFSLELRKRFSYRIDFWGEFLGNVAAELVVAYFLWRAVFAYGRVDRMGGYSFGAMMLYYLLAAVARALVIGGDFIILSQDIYDGSLTRYLVYPVSVFPYKYVGRLADFSLGLLRAGLMLSLFLFFFGMPSDRPVGVLGVLYGLGAVLASATLYFILLSILELSAFWAENVWSLSVMLRFTLLFLGGGYVPLSLFPSWARQTLHWLPFESMISLPIRCWMGEVGFAEWGLGLANLGIWGLLCAGILNWVWRRGTLQYTGVGI